LDRREAFPLSSRRRALLLRIRESGVSTEAGRRHSEVSLEGPVESSLGFVADLARDLRNAVAGAGEQPRAELQPPPCQVSDGRLSKVMPKTFGKHCAGNSDRYRKIADRPGAARLAV
jgi:hypothetical protein